MNNRQYSLRGERGQTSSESSGTTARKNCAYLVNLVRRGEKRGGTENITRLVSEYLVIGRGLMGAGPSNVISNERESMDRGQNGNWSRQSPSA